MIQNPHTMVELSYMRDGDWWWMIATADGHLYGTGGPFETKEEVIEVIEKMRIYLLEFPDTRELGKLS